MLYALPFFGYVYFCLIVSHWRVLATQQEQGVYFQFLTEKNMFLKDAFSSLTLISHSSDRNGCVTYCLANPSCKSANFRITTGECSLFGLNSWENEFNIVSDSDGLIIQGMKKSVVNHGEWTLVFRGIANIGNSVYDAYINTSLYHDQPLSPLYPIGCLRLDTNLSCDHHFRSKFLNNWSNLRITEVKFSVYKDGALQKFLLFNGSSSTSTSWFSSANFMNSSWRDLTRSPITSFSIYGFYHPSCIRRFYIEYNHPGCPRDIGWFVCVDQFYDWCPWAMPVPTFPRFLYSSTHAMDYNQAMMLADVIAIFIKF